MFFRGRIFFLIMHFSMNESSKTPEVSAPAEAAKMTVNQQHLKQAWDTSQVSTKEDWAKWMHRISVEFMKESPSHALRACITLVDLHQPLAKELFNAAFISCWKELFEHYQVSFLFRISLAVLTKSTGRSGPCDRVCNHNASNSLRPGAPSSQSMRIHGA